MIVSIDKEVNTKPKFISLCSDTTFKYLYKNIKTRSWLNNIIKELFGLDLEGYQLLIMNLIQEIRRKTIDWI